ncbi:hypothetical protein KY289_001090 [Solanum tuberosum]|nr:hypothetical protein KY289_001090 [Solanum tuberosum]
MPEDFPRLWKSLGFTHIHFGVFRVALTYHGRKGQPVVACLFLLDTRYYEYQHANLGTSKIILNAGTIFVTIFPNFNMSLHDSYLTEYTQIPRQIPRKELVKVLPGTWVTKYEKLRVHPQCLFFEEPILTIPKNDILSNFPNKRPNQIVFPIQLYQSHIDIPEDKDPYTIYWFLSGFKCEHDWIRQFDQDGRGVQWFTFPFTGNTPWNIDCDYKGCQEGDLDDADTSKSGKKCGNSEREFKRRFDDGDPTIGSLSRLGKYEFLVSYKNESALPTQNGTPKDKQAHPLFIISPMSSSHTYNLPSYSTFEKDNLIHAPKLPEKRVILKSGETMPTGNIEETSNWQSKDIMSQHRLLSPKSHSIKSITPTQVKIATKENKLIDTFVQNVGLIKAHEQRLRLIRLDKGPQGTTLFQFFDHQRQEMDFISDRILELKYGRIESVENPIPLPTSLFCLLRHIPY